MAIAKKTIVLFVVVACAVCAARASYAADACVVVSKQIAPYQEAYEGFAEIVKDVKRFDLDGKRTRGAALMSALLKSDCAVVVPIGSLALDVVRLQMTDSPIVYTMVAAPSAAASGASNVTGVSIDPPLGRLLGMLKRIVPNASRVGVVSNPTRVHSYIEAARREAHARGLTLVQEQATDMKELAAAMRELMPRVDALLMVPDPATANHQAFEYMLLESLRRGIPLIGLSRKHVKDGALFAYSVDYRGAGRSAGRMAQQVLAGAPVKSASRGPRAASFIINAKSARQLGLRIDSSITAEAAEVIR